MPITLDIQLISKPEMSFDEMKEHIARYFPSIDTQRFAINGNSQTGIVSLKLEQDALTDEQRDWLHISTFAARYIDGYKVNKPVANKTTIQAEFTQPELIMLDLGIIERRDRIAFHLEHLDPISLRTDKQAQSIKKLLKTDVERLEALHQKLNNMIEQLDITEGSRQ